MSKLVITGLGAVTPIGIGTDNFWQGIMNRECGIDKVPSLIESNAAIQIAGTVKDFKPTDYMSGKLAKEMSTFIQYAYVAAGEALEDSKFDIGAEGDRIGIVMATALAGTADTAETQEEYSSTSRKKVSPRFLPKILGNLGAAQISIAHGIHGPSFTVTTACSSGGDAISIAAMLIKSGEADAILVASGESAHCPIIMSTLSQAKALSKNPDPTTACRPYDIDRDGFVMAEGGGAILIETEEHALKRNAHIYAELAGYANNNDGYHVTAPRPDGSGSVKCMESALRKAGLTPEDIDYINTHGTSTPVGDIAECAAIKALYGITADDAESDDSSIAERMSKIPPVSSTKGNTGHMMGAGGVTEVIACIKAIENGVLPPTLNCVTPDPKCDLDFVADGPRKAEVKVAMSNALGFGGQNSSIIVKKY
ncbi:MAG: beta-ketoacyl-[acyl-carrier-protein] synthase family protein [Bacillota bacterium]|nr:beta-ketoacyl-[acyl-carrier-protein] synthase family protein [Bacillota bacterium]